MKSVFVLMAATLLFGCGKPTSTPITPDKITGSSAALEIIKYPSRVEAFALIENHGLDLDLDKLDSYTRIGPIALSPALTTNISGILSDQATYVLGGKGCIPIYGIRLRFVGQSDSVDVLLCMNWDILMFAFKKEQKYEERDFDPSRPQIVRLLKQVFPNDNVVQSLKENAH